MLGKSFTIFALVAALAVLAVPPAAASETTDVMAVVRQSISVDASGPGDVKTFLATCADSTSIVDDIPPYEWHGRTACIDWWNAWGAAAKKLGITDAATTLGRPRMIQVVAD